MYRQDAFIVVSQAKAEYVELRPREIIQAGSNRAPRDKNHALEIVTLYIGRWSLHVPSMSKKLRAPGTQGQKEDGDTPDNHNPLVC